MYEEEEEAEEEGIHERIQVIVDSNQDDYELLFANEDARYNEARDDNARSDGEQETSAADMAAVIQLLKGMKQEMGGMKRYMDGMERRMKIGWTSAWLRLGLVTRPQHP